MRIYVEERIASLVTSAGLIWAVYLVTRDYATVEQIKLPEGPIGVTGIGVLVWLHAKWRRSVDARR